MQINWDNFRTYSQDACGIRCKFEDLCRQLFANVLVVAKNGRKMTNKSAGEDVRAQLSCSADR